MTVLPQEHSRRSVLVAAATAILATIVGFTHVFQSIPLSRTKVLQRPAPAASGVVRLTATVAPELERQGPPLALILRVSHDGPPAAFSIAVDGTLECRVQIPKGSSRRTDCSLAHWTTRESHEVVVSGPPTPWSLDALELATHHGNTSGALYLVVLPGGSHRYVRPPVILVALIGVLCFVGGLRLQQRSGSLSRLARRAHAVAAVASILLLALTACSDLLSQYRVVLWFGSYLLLVAVVLSPLFYPKLLWLVQLPRVSDAQVALVFRACVVGLASTMVFAAVATARVHDSYHDNYSGLLLISRRIFDANPLFLSRPEVRQTLEFDEGGGYDGQFFYYATFDPFLRAFRHDLTRYRGVVDVAPYRYGRIGYSLLTIVFSGGKWQRFPVVMIALLMSSLGGLAALLAYEAQRRGRSAALGAIVLLIPGFWQSLQSGLPEPIAAGALVGGILSLHHRRWLLAWACFTVSLLVRETSLIAVIAAVLVGAWDAPRVPCFLACVGALFVLILWRAYVGAVLFPDWGTQAFFYHPPDLDWPLNGFIDLWRHIARRDYYPDAMALTRAGMVFPVLIVLGVIVSGVVFVSSRNPFSAAALIYGLVAVSLNYAYIWIHVGNGQRGSYELFLMIAVCTVFLEKYSNAVRRVLASFWCITGVYVFALTFDAEYIRSALLLPF